MATTQVRPSASPAPTPSGGGFGHVSGRDRPVGGFELWSWLFMRISGLVLLLLAVGHVLIMTVLDEGIDRVDFAVRRGALGHALLARLGLDAARRSRWSTGSTACGSSFRTT